MKYSSVMLCQIQVDFSLLSKCVPENDYITPEYIISVGIIPLQATGHGV
jgi:hypothetical protein